MNYYLLVLFHSMEFLDYCLVTTTKSEQLFVQLSQKKWPHRFHHQFGVCIFKQVMVWVVAQIGDKNIILMRFFMTLKQYLISTVNDRISLLDIPMGIYFSLFFAVFFKVWCILVRLDEICTGKLEHNFAMFFLTVWLYFAIYSYIHIYIYNYIYKSLVYFTINFSFFSSLIEYKTVT